MVLILIVLLVIFFFIIGVITWKEGFTFLYLYLFYLIIFIDFIRVFTRITVHFNSLNRVQYDKEFTLKYKFYYMVPFEISE